VWRNYATHGRLFLDGAAPPLRLLFVWKEFTHDYERTIHPSDAWPRQDTPATDARPTISAR